MIQRNPFAPHTAGMAPPPCITHVRVTHKDTEHSMQPSGRLTAVQLLSITEHCLAQSTWHRAHSAEHSALFGTNHSQCNEGCLYSQSVAPAMQAISADSSVCRKSAHCTASSYLAVGLCRSGTDPKEHQDRADAWTQKAASAMAGRGNGSIANSTSSHRQ